MVMLWEYFSPIFVRSSANIRFFPRATAIYFVAFHTYFYNFPMGFFGLAAAVNLAMIMQCKVFALSQLEVPAFKRGEVSYDHPR
ncbi:unnamed protein product, partial [Discosporangium mesarthrocarpum]